MNIITYLQHWYVYPTSTLIKGKNYISLKKLKKKKQEIGQSCYSVIFIFSNHVTQKSINNIKI